MSAESTIYLKDFLANIISSRDAIDKIFESYVKQNKNVTFDFTDIQFITRSAAHQLIIKMDQDSFNTKFLFKNENTEISKMIDIVRKSLHHPNSNYSIYTNLSFKTKSQFDKFLLDI